MDNLKKLVTQDTQDEEKQNKDRTQYVLDTYTQANTNNLKKTSVLLQTTGGKDEPYYASNLMRNVVTDDTIISQTS